MASPCRGVSGRIFKGSVPSLCLCAPRSSLASPARGVSLGAGTEAKLWTFDASLWHGGSVTVVGVSERILEDEWDHSGTPPHPENRGRGQDG